MVKKANADPGTLPHLEWKELFAWSFHIACGTVPGSVSGTSSFCFFPN